MKEAWDKLYNWLNDMRLGIAPDETVTDEDERHDRLIQVDILDEILDWMCVQEPKTDTWSIKDVADTLAKHGLIEEQEPCEDCISRQAVIELCEGWWLGHTKEDDFPTEVRALPSVNPQKIGHWIVGEKYYMGERNGCCSVCEDYYTNDWFEMKYCPNCGAKMVEPQESEE